MGETTENEAERTAGTAGAISGGIGLGLLVAAAIPVPVVDIVVGAVVGAVAGTEVRRRLGKATFQAGSAFVKTFNKSVADRQPLAAAVVCPREQGCE
jgi:uncharacterized membrane protein